MGANRFGPHLAATALAAAMAGCALQAPPTVSELQQQALPNTTVPAAWKAAADAAAVVDRWLATFGDAQGAMSVSVLENMASRARE